MQEFHDNTLDIYLNREGAKKYQKLSYPVRYGLYSIVETPDFIYHYDLNGNIKHLQPKIFNSWARDEWLKRTEGNDWVYYTPGIYSGLLGFIGEYYLPCFSYETNNIFAFRPHENNSTQDAVLSVDRLTNEIEKALRNVKPGELGSFLGRAALSNLKYLKKRGEDLHKIIGGRTTVLPPDTRHVDYDVIPINIADGCLYKCGFCRVKNIQSFKARSRQNVLAQIKELKTFFGNNIINYNSVFFGQHDALGAGQDLVEYSAEKAYFEFDFKNSIMQDAYLFMFASVDSFLKAGDAFFSWMNSTPFYTYINIGLESAEQGTLDILKKPLSSESVREAYHRAVEINRNFEKIEITSNFIISDSLKEEHYSSIIDLLNKGNKKFYSKGSVYFSPLYGIKNKVDVQKMFINIKNRLHVPVYIYIIQRL